MIVNIKTLDLDQHSLQLNEGQTIKDLKELIHSTLGGIERFSPSNQMLIYKSKTLDDETAQIDSVQIADSDHILVMGILPQKKVKEIKTKSKGLSTKVKTNVSKVDADALNRLLHLGFARNISETALKLCNNNFELASNFILEQQESGGIPLHSGNQEPAKASDHLLAGNSTANQKGALDDKDKILEMLSQSAGNSSGDLQFGDTPFQVGDKSQFYQTISAKLMEKHPELRDTFLKDPSLLEKTYETYFRSDHSAGSASGTNSDESDYIEDVDDDLYDKLVDMAGNDDAIDYRDIADLEEDIDEEDMDIDESDPAHMVSSNHGGHELTDEDKANIEILMSLGHSKEQATITYLQCGKSLDAAANILIDDQEDNRDT